MNSSHFKTKLISLLLIMMGYISAHAQVKPRLQSDILDEVSGLVASKRTIYIHNDSGDTSRFFAIDKNGRLLSTLYFQGEDTMKRFGVTDCEDIAMGPGPKKGKNYIYLGDIGDNGADRSHITIYRFQEPRKLSPHIELQTQAVYLKYPDGSQDSETMMIDPILSKLIIVSKRQDTVGIFSTPLSYANGDTVVLAKQGKLFLPGGFPDKHVVSGDISKDGRQILLKTYANVYYWLRKGNESISKTLQRKPIELPYTREPQGEAIGFSSDGKGYYCISEGKKAIIYYYQLPRIP